MKNQEALYTFQLLHEGHRLLRRLISEFGLCPKLCYMQKTEGPCTNPGELPCSGACEQKESPAEYNERILRARDYLSNHLPTFAVVDDGKDNYEQSCVLVERGRFYGMGYIPADAQIATIDQLKNHLTQYPESDYIRGLIYNYAEKQPAKKRVFTI